MCLLVLSVAILAVCKTREQGVLKNFHTWLWNIQLVVGSVCWLPWTLQMDKLNTVVSSLVLGLNSSPYRCTLWAQIFIPPSDGIYVRRILFNFVLNFWWSVITYFVKYNSNTICIWGGVVIAFKCCVLVPRFEISSYACLQ